MGLPEPPLQPPLLQLLLDFRLALNQLRLPPLPLDSALGLHLLRLLQPLLRRLRLGLVLLQLPLLQLLRLDLGLALNQLL